MKKNSLPVILAFLAFISLCSLIVVVTPAFIPHFNFSTDETANIGTTIGGIVGPIVSMFSAYLLYEALTAQLDSNKAQADSNKDQRLKAESDIIFMLLNQLDKEYDSFYIEQKRGDEKNKYYGYEAFARNCKIFKDKSNDVGMYEIFRGDFNTNKLNYLISSINLIRERIDLSELNESYKAMFNRKLDLYYRSKFKFPVKHLVEAFGSVDDAVIKEIIDFKRINDNIN